MLSGPAVLRRDGGGQIHFACAAVLIFSLRAICFYFSYRERRAGNPGVAQLQRTCGAVIVAAVVWVAVGSLIGLDLWELTPLYVGEVVSVWAFGVSWLTGSRDLWRRMVPVLERPTTKTASIPTLSGLQSVSQRPSPLSGSLTGGASSMISHGFTVAIIASTLTLLLWRQDLHPDGAGPNHQVERQKFESSSPSQL